MYCSYCYYNYYCYCGYYFVVRRGLWSKIDVYSYFKIIVKMNPLSYYTNSKNEWNDEESNQLIKEYIHENLTIIQIGDIHKRTPGYIGYKLKKLGIITNNTMARGYDEYKKSALYNEIVSSNPKNTLSNANKSWTAEDTNKLLNFIQHKKSISEIAIELERTDNSITKRLQVLAAQYWFLDKLNIDDIIKTTNLSKKQVINAIASHSIKMEQKAKNISIKKDEVKASVETSDTKQIIELLKDIQTKLSLLIEKVS